MMAVAAVPLPAQAQQGRRQAELERLHQMCNQGNRGACVRFGIMIGQNRERVAEWRRLHPDWWWWERE
jgi:hypothetical protein